MPLSHEQIEAVIQWMNTWEQLKDTAIPMRFKEDFLHKSDDERLCEKLRREKIGDELKLISDKMDKKSKQELLQNPLVKEIALKFANEFRVTELCENMWDEFVKSNEPVREWEILEFKYDGLLGRINEFVLLPDGKYTSNIQNFTYTLDEILSCKTAVIQTVKRLSDGEIFVVGDNTQVGIITSFEIQGQNMIAKGSEFEYHINQLQKAKREHIFTTDDNVKIYEGDEYFFCGEPLVVYSSKAVWYDIDGALQNTGNKHFSTREKAEEYCTMNRPCLSIQAMLDDGLIVIGSPQTQGLIELAKAKQNKC